MSIVDKERNAVAMTCTVNSYFGSKILSPNTGIVLNNQMSDFSIPTKLSAKDLPPAPSNFILPGKRPLSSTSPTIVLKVNSYHILKTLYRFFTICTSYNSESLYRTEK